MRLIYNDFEGCQELRKICGCSKWIVHREHKCFILIFKGGIMAIILFETLKVCSLEHQVSGCFFSSSGSILICSNRNSVRWKVLPLRKRVKKSFLFLSFISGFDFLNTYFKKQYTFSTFQKVAYSSIKNSN